MNTNTAIKNWKEHYSHFYHDDSLVKPIEQERNKGACKEREINELRAALEAANHRIEDLTTAANRCINDALGMAGTAQHGDADPLSEFQEGQWWVLALDRMAQSATDLDQKRAVAVVHHLLRSAAIAQRAGSGEARPVEKERADFEDWYCTHAFNYAAAPIGSRDCMLQWSSWIARGAGTYSARADWKIAPLPWGIAGADPVSAQPDSERDAALKKAVHVWWIGKRPCAWDEQKHAENYGVNCQGDAEYALAAMAAQQNNKGG